MNLPANRKISRFISNISLVVFDFDGVFTDNYIWLNEDGKESIRFWRGDGIGLNELRKIGIDALVLSSEVNKIVSVRCKKLRVPCIRSAKNKLETLTRHLKRRKLSFNEVAYVGNDINDVACLEAVGFPIIVRDAHASLLKVSKYRTRRKGGCGAVREVCDLFLAAHKQKER